MWFCPLSLSRCYGSAVVLKKSLGQHLLKDENVLHKILKEAHISIHQFILTTFMILNRREQLRV